MKLFSRTGLAAAVTAAALSTTVLAAPAMAAEPAAGSSDLLTNLSVEADDDDKGTAEGSLDLFTNLSSGEDDKEDNVLGSIEDATSFLQLISVGLTVATAVVGLVSAF